MKIVSFRASCGKASERVSSVYRCFLGAIRSWWRFSGENLSKVTAKLKHNPYASSQKTDRLTFL
jgi:hypothetical protein